MVDLPYANPTTVNIATLCKSYTKNIIVNKIHGYQKYYGKEVNYGNKNTVNIIN